MSKKKVWRQSIGEYGNKLRVGERAPGSVLYVFWVDSNDKTQKRSLGHRDRKKALIEARDLANQLAADRDPFTVRSLTVDTLIDIYVEHGLQGRGESYAKEARAKLARWRDFLGGSRLVESLSRSDIDRYLAARRRGDVLPLPAGRALSRTTLWHDWVALNTALWFAVKNRDSRGRRWLDVHPLPDVRIGKTVSPNRSVAREKDYLGLREVASQVSPMLETLLDLAYATGHRIDAILNLKWSDVVLEPTEDFPHGGVHWCWEVDTIDNGHTTPLNELASVALQRRRVIVSSEWIFPAPKNPAVPITPRLVGRWFRKAEVRGGIPHQRGRGWHAFRRGWASDRMHLPDVAVAAAGGWKDTKTMKQAYQHATAADILRVVCAAKSA